MPLPRFRLLALILTVVLSFGVGCEIETGGEETPAPPGDVPATTNEAAPALSSSTDAAPFDTSRDGRTVAARIEDAMVAAAVRKALVDTANLRLFDFEVDVREGIVRLRGDTVETAEQLALATDITRGVEGVRGVTNELAALERPADTTAGQATPAPSEQALPEKKESATYHTVKRGDTLGAIAKQYGVTVEEVRRLNDTSLGTLRPGQRLRVK